MSIGSKLTRRVRNFIGDRAMTQGTYVGTASSYINTELKICEAIFGQGTAIPSGTARPTFNVSTKLPAPGEEIAYRSDSAGNITDAGGHWFAIGRL